jgi:Domain of unknown function (DUF4292)
VMPAISWTRRLKQENGMNKYSFAFFLIGLGLFISCRSSQIVTDPGYKDPLLSHEYYKAKGKLEIFDGKGSQKVVAHLRIRKDSLIWISISSKIEAARIMITRDSIKFLDRINKSFYSNSLDSMGKLFNFSFDFELIQNLLTSRTPVSSKIQWKKSEKDLIGIEKRNTWMLEYILDSEQKKLKKLMIREIQGPSKLIINYSGIFGFEGGAVAKSLESEALFFKDKKPVTVKTILIYEKFNFASKGEIKFSFRIPSKYERL